MLVAAAAAGAIAIPTATIGILVDGPTAFNLLLTLVILVAFLTAGWVAAGRQPQSPFTHAVGAALALIVVVEAAGAIRRALDDAEQTTLPALAFRLLLTTTFALLGASARSSRVAG